VAYAIGVAQPVGLHIDTFGTVHVKNSKGKLLNDREIGERINKLFDMRPYAIVKRFGLKILSSPGQHHMDISAVIILLKTWKFIMKCQEANQN